jgi:proline iminopeptidase
VHPPIEPFTSGRLDRPGRVELHWEISGNPDGKPALYLHGGPGGGLGSGGYRRIFDPSTYQIVGLDQRGCGQSTPWAIDSLDTLDDNTTSALIDDIEALREHLGVDRWLLYGVSWGSTLALAYALAHPNRVTEIVLMAVTSGSREEIDWITEDVGPIFPEAWARLASLAEPGERIIEAYARMLRSPSTSVRRRAAEEWDAWESTHVSLDPLWKPGPHRADPRDRENFATLVTHYWAQDCFLVGPDRILDRVGELAQIPGVLIHGRRDVSGPASTAWQLHRAWPGSSLHIVEDEGHGGPRMAELASAAIDSFG